MTKRVPSLAVLGAALALSACGNAVPGAAAPGVAARVNGNDISVQQVVRIVEQAADTASQRPTPAQALERLIDQELLVQRAVAAKLDRDPRVVQAIAEEQRRVLGQAYLERALPRAPKRTPGEIRKFFADNPALFERRRIYRVHELLAVVPEDQQASLKARISAATRLDDIADWLRTRSLPFSDVVSVRPAEQIPIEILLRIAEMKDAQVAMFVAPDKVSILELVHAEDAPLTERQAAPVIERLLADRWRLERASKEIARLREAATIEYLGPFDTVAAGKRHIGWTGRQISKGPPVAL